MYMTDSIFWLIHAQKWKAHNIWQHVNKTSKNLLWVNISIKMFVQMKLFKNWKFKFKVCVQNCHCPNDAQHWNYSPCLPKLPNWLTLCFHRTQTNEFKYKALSTLLISDTLLTVSWETYSQVMMQVKWILNGHTPGCPKFIKAKKECSLSYWNNVSFKIKLSTVETQQLNPQLAHSACILTIAKPYFFLLNKITFFHEFYRSMRINIWVWWSISDRQFWSIYQRFISGDSF